MREKNLRSGSLDTGEYCDKRAQQNTGASDFAPEFQSSKNLEHSFSSENVRENNSNFLLRAMGAVDRPLPISQDESNSGSENQTFRKLSLEEELEKELVSSFQHETSSLSMPDLHDEGKLENAIKAVSHECDKLIAVCETPDETNSEYLDSVPKRRTFPMSLGIGTERIGGILKTSKNDASDKKSKRKLAVSLVVLIALGSGFYTYLEPGNMVELASLSSNIKQRAYELPTVISRNVKNLFTNQVPMPENTSLQAKNSPVFLKSPIHLSIGATGGLGSEFQNDLAQIIAGPPFIPSPDTRQPIVRLVEDQDVSVARQNPANDVVILPERFNQTFEDRIIEHGNKELIVQKFQASNTPPNNIIKASLNESKVVKPEPKIALKKRDRGSVMRTVLAANTGEVLNEVQINALVSHLAEGDCLSSALATTFGDNRISPFFVRGVLNNLENGC